MAAVKIDSPIVGYKVLSEDGSSSKDTPPADHAVPYLPRPLKLMGTTYKIKPPTEETGLYVTINDVVVNPGTERASKRPYEIFLNSKALSSYMWVTSLTVTISALMRSGQDLSFLPEHLMQIADPKTGGYWGRSRQPGVDKGMFYISVVAEIGYILKYHLQELKLMEPDPLTINEEKAINASAIPEPVNTDTVAKAAGEKCPKCGETMKLMDGCWTCVYGCGYSKCG